MAKVAKTLRHRAFRGLFTLAILTYAVGSAQAGPLDEELSETRWAKLKEVERYQLKVADKFYREHQYKVAADEYEKFLKLYDRSEGASYSQLKWSHCQVELRKLNTAIKDGYQSVLDYYPDSPEGPIAALLIGRTHVSAGDTKLAKKAFSKAISSYPKHFTAVMARYDLVDIAKKENDVATHTALLNQLTFDVERKGPTVDPCVNAARQLAQLSFQAGNFEAGLKAIATVCKEEDVPNYVTHPSWGRVSHIIYELTGATDEPTKKLGEKLADAAAAWLKVQAAAAIKDEKTKKIGIDTWYSIAELRRLARQPDKQKIVFEEIGATLGVDDNLLKHLARWYITNKQMDQARQQYLKFKDISKGKGLVASSYLEENQCDKAAAAYLELAASDPKATDIAIYADWKTSAASAYRRGGKPKEAIDIYTELAQRDVGKANEYRYEIAETHFYSHRWKECIAAYRGVEAHQPHVYQQMAEANRQLKQFQEAINLYRTIMGSYPGSASEALYQIGVTYEQWGPDHKEDAIETFKQVCNKFPKSTHASQSHLLLNEKYKRPVTLGGAKD